MKKTDETTSGRRPFPVPGFVYMGGVPPPMIPVPRFFKLWTWLNLVLFVSAVVYVQYEKRDLQRIVNAGCGVTVQAVNR
jgi:hypothetical protein